MRYCLMLKPHANSRYAQSLQKLALAELQCILSAWAIPAEASLANIAGVQFLAFEMDEFPERAWEAISGHSVVCMAAAMEGELLRPILMNRNEYLPGDLAEVLKYKGKTNVDFTAMMLHCARAASDFAREREPLTVLDPICGRGTTLFCALQEGYHAAGADIDEKAVSEADVYFSRYLKYHKVKHRREKTSATLPKGPPAREIRYSFANTPEAYRQNEGRMLRLFLGDTRNVHHMIGEKRCHLIVGDMPYGVQHAPKEGPGRYSFEGLLPDAMKAYQKVLMPGGAIALSFNTYTLQKKVVEEAMQLAGLTILSQPPYQDFSHWVEQAVNRDFVVARKDRKS